MLKIYYLFDTLKIRNHYYPCIFLTSHPHLTAPASMKAKPHCMKKMMMDMMSRKKWSISFGFERLSWNDVKRISLIGFIVLAWLRFFPRTKVSSCGTNLTWHTSHTASGEFLLKCAQKLVKKSRVNEAFTVRFSPVIHCFPWKLENKRAKPWQISRHCNRFTSPQIHLRPFLVPIFVKARFLGE